MSGTPIDPIFDRIAVADWSASARPKTVPKSIWIAVLDVAGDGALTLTNPATRCDALDVIAALAVPGRRTLLGVDFSLGYPAGTAAACGLGGQGAPAWQAMWNHLGASIVDDDRNRNNRFSVASRLNTAMGDGPGPFWGCSPSSVDAVLTSTKPDRQDAWPDEWRLIESRLRSTGHRPFSAWQLLGAGAVGGQSLVGIAALDRLRRSLGARMEIWPFTTGLEMDLRAARADGADGAEIVVAEVWPSLWEVNVPVGVVKDAAQVESSARRLAALDASGELSRLLRPELGPDVAAVVTDEEGWLLGVSGVPG